MYKKILALLDGSELSESSLKHIKAIADAFKVSEVVLLRILLPLSTQTASACASVGDKFLTRAMQQKKGEAVDYLFRLESTLKKEGIPTQAVLYHGEAAEEILDYANKNEVDLILMSTHGRSGLSRLLLGSVTERVLRHSTVPVLVIPPN